MIEAWVLMVLLSSGELAVYPMPSERACDVERIEILALASRHDICPAALDAQCLEALVDLDSREGAE